MLEPLESKIESVLLFKNEPVSVIALAEELGEKPEALRAALASLQSFYQNRGIVVVSDGEKVSLGTHPNMSGLIEKLQKEELTGELSRAGLETLAIILYKGPITRREIDYIRSVSSGFIIRSLLIRGLVERTEGAGRSYSYKATLKLLEYLGITSPEDLPEYRNAFKKLEEFVETPLTAQDG